MLGHHAKFNSVDTSSAINVKLMWRIKFHVLFALMVYQVCAFHTQRAQLETLMLVSDVGSLFVSDIRW